MWNEFDQSKVEHKGVSMSIRLSKYIKVEEDWIDYYSFIVNFVLFLFLTFLMEWHFYRNTFNFYKLNKVYFSINKKILLNLQ